MEDSAVKALKSVNEIEEDYEPFTNPEDVASCNYFILDNYESSECSNSNNEEDDDFYEDKTMRASRLRFTNEINKARQCALCNMKTRFY